MEEALIEEPTLRRVGRIDLLSDRIPDEIKSPAIRRLLEKHGLGGGR